MATFKEKIGKLRERQLESPTALTPNVAPTKTDLKVDAELRSARSKEEADRLSKMKDKWAGPQMSKKDSADLPGERKPGVLENVTNFLSVPARLLGGVVDTATGQGEGNLIENVESSVKNKIDYGNRLTKAGVPYAVSAPLGLTMDIALDPSNWVTAGTTALIPRIGKGIIKGAEKKSILKGAALAASSGLSQKGEALLRFFSPGFRKVQQQVAAEAIGSKETYGWMGRFARKTVSLTDEYDKMVDGGVPAFLKKAREKDEAFKTAMNAFGTKVGAQKAADLWGFAKYDDTGQFARLHDVEAEATGELKGGKVMSVHGMVDTSPAGKRLQSIQGQPADWVAENTDEAYRAKMATEGSYPKTGSSGEFAVGLAMEAEEEVRRKESLMNAIKQLSDKYSNDPQITDRLELMGKLPESEQGDFYSLISDLSAGKPNDVPNKIVAGWDRAMVKFLTLPTHGKTVRNITKGYLKALTSWKNLTTSLSLPTQSVNFIGNGFLANLMGFNPMKSEFLSKLGSTTKDLLKNDPELAYKSFKNTGLWQEMLDFHPELFEKTFGINAGLVKYGDDHLVQTIKAMTVKAGSPDPEIAKLAEEAIAKFRAIQRAEMASATKRSFNVAGIKKVGEDLFATEGGKTSMMMQEVMNSTASKFIKDLEISGAKGNKFDKALHFMLTKPAEVAGVGDQAYRIATARSMVEDGVSLGELVRLDKWMHFEPGDIGLRVGNNYTLSPKKAMEFASRAYLDYSAMPGFARIAKNIPILGSPFMSWQIGATAQTIRALGLNTSYFTRINFLIKELSGEQTPSEKEEADSQYNARLQEPGWMKMPFFRDNPTFINMGGYIPQYSINYFRNPDNRDIEAEYGPDVAKLVTAINYGQNTGLMSGPEGRFLVDYMLVPMITGELINSTGAVQYPESSGLLERLGLGVTGALSQAVPRSVGDAAALVPVNPPVESLPYLPRSYANLKKTLQGITTGFSQAQNPQEEQLKALGSEAGFPTAKMNIKPPPKK